MTRCRFLFLTSLWIAIGGWPGAAEELLRTSGEPGRPGGTLVVALRAEPKTLNPVGALNNPSLTVVRRLMADLVHIDRHTQRTVPALAKSWSVSSDGRVYTLELRRGVRFSDGEPFDADDVVFTFEVLLDGEIASPHRDLLTVDGQPIVVRKLGSHSVRFELAKPYTVGERLFDSVPILPRHRLETAYREGGFEKAWTLASPPAEITGLGPFRFRRYVPGVRLELERNPYYWKVDSEGRRLPYLDGITFVFVPTEDAQVLSFQAGETHLIDRLSARNFNLLARQKERGGYVLEDLGAGLNYDFLFFNLNDLEGRGYPALEAKQKWFRGLAFRRAISAAIDREGIARVVYAGRATPIATHVTPGNKLWMHPGLAVPRQSPETARELLGSAGFVWNEAGQLHDAAGKKVELTIVTNSSNTERMGIATIIQEDLARIGIEIRVAGLEFGALMERLFQNYDYEACILGIGGGDVDPNSSLNILTSGGSHHLWQLDEGSMKEAWQTEIDRLMADQLTTIDRAQRQKLYFRVQELVAANLPMIPVVSPNILTGAARDLGNFRPSILDHYTLWNADELYWRSSPER